jgi:hypothetical protein
MLLTKFRQRIFFYEKIKIYYTNQHIRHKDNGTSSFLDDTNLHGDLNFENLETTI